MTIIRAFENESSANRITILGAGPGSSITGATTETALALVTIPAGSMGTQGSLRITALFSYTNSANTKTMRIRFGTGGAAVAHITVAQTATATCTMVRQIINTTATTQISQPVSSLLMGSTSASVYPSSSIDTTVDQFVHITGTLANGAESIQLAYYCVELIPSVS